MELQHSAGLFAIPLSVGSSLVYVNQQCSVHPKRIDGAFCSSGSSAAHFSPSRLLSVLPKDSSGITNPELGAGSQCDLQLLGQAEGHTLFCHQGTVRQLLWLKQQTLEHHCQPGHFLAW